MQSIEKACNAFLQGLDELQSYVLLRRWAQDEGVTFTDAGLSQRQRASIQTAFFTERNYIYSCLACLLQPRSGNA